MLDAAGAAPPAAHRAAAAMPIDRALEDRILALDPDRIGGAELRQTLSQVSAPRLLLLHGGVFPVHLLMESFAEFLVAMGYPLDSIRGAGDGALSLSPYESSERQAGLVAWYYEREGLRPVLIGHSQGGIQALKILHELAGSFGNDLRVASPLTGEFEGRTTIVDPLTGARRSVVGLSVAHASVVGTGGWSLALPVHWVVLPLARTVPDSVDEFTSYRIGVDLFAWDVPGLEALKTFRANGRARIRNVTLPAHYSHVFVPGTTHLVEDRAVRDWIDAFNPDDPANWTPPPEFERDNLLWAADVWHSLKRHWVLETQRLIVARRNAVPKP